MIVKDIRRQLGIKEGQPMEFFIDGEDIVIRKHTLDNCENETFNSDDCKKTVDSIEQGADGSSKQMEEQK